MFIALHAGFSHVVQAPEKYDLAIRYLTRASQLYLTLE